MSRPYERCKHPDVDYRTFNKRVMFSQWNNQTNSRCRTLDDGLNGSHCMVRNGQRPPSDGGRHLPFIKSFAFASFHLMLSFAFPRGESRNLTYSVRLWMSLNVSSEWIITTSLSEWETVFHFYHLLSNSEFFCLFISDSCFFIKQHLLPIYYLLMFVYQTNNPIQLFLAYHTSPVRCLPILLVKHLDVHSRCGPRPLKH